MTTSAVTVNQLEAHLWEAANILRGPVDAADFKTYVFPLLFFKRLSDVHDEEYQAALSPDPCLSPYQTDYKWLTQVYESVKPPSDNGRLLWHALGAKTVELINQNVHLEAVRDDLETLVLDAQVLEEILTDIEPGKRAREVEVKLVARLRKHLGHPIFTAPAWSSSNRSSTSPGTSLRPRKTPTLKRNATAPEKR
jgi:hypothetical protein